MFWRKVQRSATRVLRPRCKRDAWLNAPAIQVQESAKNPSRHGLNIIARVTLQTISPERSGRCKCTNGVHMPRKNGEEQVLLLAVPLLRKRNPESSSYVGGPIRTACSRIRARAAAGSVKLINVLKLDVVTSRRRWLSVSRRICVLQSSDGGATPG